MKLKIGLFGGSFNPTHNGHIAIAASAVNQLQLDKVIVLPNHVSPFKSQLNQVQGIHKLHMLQSLVMLCPSRFSISNFEMLKSVSYTHATLEFFHHLFPSAEIFFLMGYDSFQSFTMWKKWESILELSHLLLFSRVQYPIDSHYNSFSQKHRARIIYADFTPPSISSSHVRAAIRHGKKYHTLVPFECLRIYSEKKFI